MLPVVEPTRACLPPAPPLSACVAVTNVFLGNLLVLPTTIAWLEFMDGIGLFMVAPKATAPAPTCVAWDA